MSRPRLLDEYCCQGGASRGYEDAGFEVFGVDIDPQPRYPYWFHQGDALDVLRRLKRGEGIVFQRGNRSRTMYLRDFDAIHASPPCQFYSLTHRIMRGDFPDLIGPTRELLEQTGLPYVIENVMEAAPELCNPVMLCGEMFGLETYRHRLFEANWEITPPEHPAHVARTTKMGRTPVEGEYMHIVGNFTGVDKGREVMGMPWASRDGLREAIPPAYSNFVGAQLIDLLPRKEKAA
jgi:DNA (cytosine-5)-methyltransferase 1